MTTSEPLAMAYTKQPRHRRPSFMRDANTYRIHLQANPTRSTPAEFIDPDLDGYCYNPEFYPRWKLAATLRDKLPEDLTGLIDDWAYAGAAVQTSIHRIKVLDHEGLDRPWPEPSRIFQTGGDGSQDNLQHVSSLASPDLSITSSAGDGGPARLPPLYTANVPALLNTQLETPPYSPDDPKSTETLVTPPTDRPNIDLTKLNERLTNFELAKKTASESGGSDVTPPSGTLTTPSMARFNLNCWERYVEQYRQEIDGLKVEDWPRFHHMHYKVKLAYRIHLEENPGCIDEHTQAEFMAWWQWMTKNKDKLEEEIFRISMPSYYEIRHVRGLYGLPV